MIPKAGYCTPLLHVADVARSIRFYRLLGFQLVDVEGGKDCPGWARIHCEGGALMFLSAEKPIRPSEQGVLFYLYASDLPGLRRHLLASGVEVSPIGFPDYMRSGEIHLKDPDGYTVLIGQWGQAEHEAWEKQLAEKRKAGVL